jgi:hypothetical protein
MTFDDELRRRLQQAAERAGEGTDVEALVQSVSSVATTGAGAVGAPWKMLGALGAGGLVVGGALGLTVLRPDTRGADTTPRVQPSGSVFDCPDGSPVATIQAGDRLFAIGRTDDGSWLAVRGLDGDAVNWLPASGLEVDDNRDLPVLTCAETIIMVVGASGTSTTMPPATTAAPTTTTSPPVTTATPTTAPTTVPPDIQRPVVQVSTDVTEIYDNLYPACDNEAVLTAIATDNVGVVSVTGSWSGLAGSPAAFAKGSGTTWTLRFGPFTDLGFAYNELVAITVTARDAAGNSQSTTVQVRVYGECLL